MSASAYTQHTHKLTSELEQIVKECYPVVEARVEALSWRLLRQLRAKGVEGVSFYGAREIVLKLVLATQGAILDIGE